MRENNNNDFMQLENLGYELLDPTTALAEICDELQYIPIPAPQLSAEDLDRFDTLSYAIPSAPITDLAAGNKVNWQEKMRYLEASLSNGCIWLFDQDRSDEVCAQAYKHLFNLAVDHLNQQQPTKSTEEILAEFDAWAGTPMDILSPYGDIDFNHNFYEDSFEVNVPVSIISQNEEIIVKANMPWVKAKRFENVDNLPQVDLKGVLSLLPVRVNSREVKVSFDNGEFRLEAPRMEVGPETAKQDIKAQ